MSPDDYMAKASRANAPAQLLLADYTGEEVAADKVRWAVEQAGAFVEAVQRTLAPRKPTSGIAPE